MRWERRLRKPKAEGGATICEKHDFIAEHFGDPDMSWEVDQVISQAKDDGERMEARIQELREEVTDLNDAWQEMKTDRDRLAAELARVRRNHLRRMAEAVYDRTVSMQLEAVKRGEFDRNVHHRLKTRMERFRDACLSELERLQAKEGK